MARAFGELKAQGMLPVVTVCPSAPFAPWWKAARPTTTGRAPARWEGKNW
jgi:hypothetical protein